MFNKSLFHGVSCEAYFPVNNNDVDSLFIKLRFL